MKIVITLILLISINISYANCSGCCSHHGGVTCSVDITKCKDGTVLSYKCLEQNCNKCPSISKPKASIVVKTSIAIQPKYNRKFFKHWVDQDKDCQNTRAEILIQYNIGKLTFKTDKKCVVVTGKWIDPYSDKIFTNANDLDVDHIISLKHAYISGAKNWDKKTREAFANSPDNLLPVWKKLNRQKGAKSPSQWLPPLESYRCEYLTKWKTLKEKYKLQQTKREISSINSINKLCPLTKTKLD